MSTVNFGDLPVLQRRGKAIDHGHTASKDTLLPFSKAHTLHHAALHKEGLNEFAIVYDAAGDIPK